MEDLHPNDSALEDYLQSLNHLFVDITRLTFEKGYAEIAGGFCELKVATLDSGMPAAKLVAAKTLRLGTRETMPKRLALRLARELKVWARLQHPHVLPLLGFYLCSEHRSAVLISEYMGHGDLKKYIANMKPSFHERLRLIRDLTEGLTYLHTQAPPIRHGDLKPGNVLVNPDRRALLADFGLSKALDSGPTGFTTSNDARFTLRYSSPEVLLHGTIAESLSNDIWSWGCLVLEALTDEVPFADVETDAQLILALVAEGRSPSKASNISLCPQQLQNLLAKCWSRQPKERPSAANCLCIVHCLCIIDSTLLALEAPKTGEVTLQPSKDDQAGIRQCSIGEHGGPTGIAEEMGSVEDVLRSVPALVPSGVVAGRIRPRDSSMPPQQLSNVPTLVAFRRDSLDLTAPEKQSQRHSTDNKDSTGDIVGGERQRKRIRADAGPTALSTSLPPKINTRRDRARLNDSPDADSFPQFALPPIQLQYSQTDFPDMPRPQDYRFPKLPGAEPRQRGSEAGIVPPQLHITERQYHPAEGSRRGPQQSSDFTLVGATTPTNPVLTPTTRRSSVPSDSEAGFPLYYPYPRYAHRYSRSSSDILMDFEGNAVGGPITSSPPPIDGGRRFTLARATTPVSSVLTPMTRRSSIPSDSEASFPRSSPYPQLGYRYSSSSPRPSSSYPLPGSTYPPPGLSYHSLARPRSAGGSFSAGTSGTHIVYPHSQQPGHTGPGPAVKPTLNAQGQRTCRECGQPGRYKDGKCVEKWGPGPAGPGTVCDRCRKKMKRLERRGTRVAGSLGQQIPLQALSSAQLQQPQLSPRQYYPPQSQSSSPREGPQYSPSEGALPAREFQFQPPLSPNSLTSARGSKDWSTEPRHGRTGSITTTPTSQQPKSNQPASPKPREKRRAPTYSPSPPPDNASDLMCSGMGTAAEVSEVALVDGMEVVSPEASAEHKVGEDDADVTATWKVL